MPDAASCNKAKGWLVKWKVARRFRAQRVTFRSLCLPPKGKRLVGLETKRAVYSNLDMPRSIERLGTNFALAYTLFDTEQVAALIFTLHDC